MTPIRRVFADLERRGKKPDDASVATHFDVCRGGNVMKALAVIILLYLLGGASGVVELMTRSPVERAAGVTYSMCIVLGIAGAFAAFKDRPRLFRNTMLWAIGIPSLVYVSNEISLLFPAFFHLPVTFGSNYSTGQFTRCGVDVIPSVLFLLTWYVRNRGQTASRINDPETNESPS